MIITKPLYLLKLFKLFSWNIWLYFHNKVYHVFGERKRVLYWAALNLVLFVTASDSSKILKKIFDRKGFHTVLFINIMHQSFAIKPFKPNRDHRQIIFYVFSSCNKAYVYYVQRLSIVTFMFCLMAWCYLPLLKIIFENGFTINRFRKLNFVLSWMRFFFYFLFYFC